MPCQPVTLFSLSLIVTSGQICPAASGKVALIINHEVCNCNDTKTAALFISAPIADIISSHVVEKVKTTPSNTRLIVLISLVLIFASFFSLAHASQHLFHTTDQSCAAFISVENSSGLGNPCAVLYSEHNLFLHEIVAGTQAVISIISFTILQPGTSCLLISDCVIPVLY